MLPEHLSEAMKFCPHQKTFCLQADGCSVIAAWAEDHRGNTTPAEWNGFETMREKNARGGSNKAKRRLIA